MSIWDNTVYSHHLTTKVDMVMPHRFHGNMCIVVPLNGGHYNSNIGWAIPIGKAISDIYGWATNIS